MTNHSSLTVNLYLVLTFMWCLFRIHVANVLTLFFLMCFLLVRLPCVFKPMSHSHALSESELLFLPSSKYAFHRDSDLRPALFFTSILACSLLVCLVLSSATHDHAPGFSLCYLYFSKQTRVNSRPGLCLTPVMTML